MNHFLGHPFLSDNPGYLYNEIFISPEYFSLWNGKIFTESTQSWSHLHLLLPTPMYIWISHRPMRTMVHTSRSSCYPWLSNLLVRDKEAASEPWKTESCSWGTHPSILFSQHVATTQNDSVPTQKWKGNRHCFRPELELSPFHFTGNEVSSLGLAFVWGLMSNTNRKQWIVSFLQSLIVLPVAQDLGFDKQRPSKYREIHTFTFTCFGIFLLTS